VASKLAASQRRGGLTGNLSNELVKRNFCHSKHRFGDRYVASININ
jgi:hypothetical protein